MRFNAGQGNSLYDGSWRWVHDDYGPDVIVIPTRMGTKIDYKQNDHKSN